MKKIRLCVFDMDGLLIDSEKIYLLAAMKCSDLYGYGINEELVKSTMGNNLPETKRKYLAAMGQDFPFEEFLERMEIIHKDYLDNNPLEKKKGVDEILDYLDTKGIQKVIATSTFRETADRFLKSVALDGRFDHIVYGDDLSESKPKPQIYLKAIEPFPYDKEEILAFEDSANGILSAHAAGLKVVHIPDIAYIPEEIKEKSFIVLKDLLEAIKLIDSINE
ncbi:MAG: HAD family phosphatase [Erysipelotrichaceae bacterium]|nr:HAD family phosphatase [Erysipelotrichaceae bacterium]MBR4485494.1 HAD family phosphatase [Erysipelotrichaceae bacterium]MEE3408888.1 HAD family phosphatase [Erysipelotrichaceae bacterium]